MKSYDTPPDTTDMEPEAASAAIHKVMADAAADTEHPYSNPAHAQHRDYAGYVQRLFQAKYRDHDGLSDTQRACQEALEGKAVKDEAAREALRKEAQAEIDALEKLGFDPVEVPDDVQPHQIGTWKMQRLHAENNFAALEPMMAQALQGLKLPADIVSMFGTFTAAKGLDSELKSGISEHIIRWIHRANKERYGRGKS